MVAFDVFRRTLARALLDEADRRRRACARGGAPDDRATIALLERLAADAATLDLHVFLLGQLILTHRGPARRYAERWDSLLAQVGVTVSPRSATDLVRWMNRQVLSEDPVHGWEPPALSPPRLPHRLAQMRAGAGERLAVGHVLVSVADDFCALFGIVAPMLAVWEVGQGLGQWRDRVVSDAHPAVPATIVSAGPIGGDRDAGLASSVVLGFRPTPSADLCRVSVRVAAHGAETGQTMMVVPRSANCEPPLIVAEMGDPMLTLALAAGLLAAGLAALNRWSRRAARQAPPHVDPPRHAWHHTHAVR